MNQEIEAKFLNVEFNSLRKKLENVGGLRKMSMRVMRRTLFDYPDGRFQNNGNTQRLRVRDEGDKTTVAFKYPSETQYDNEIETTVESYDAMLSIFTAIGLKVYSEQESKRETWQVGDVEVVLDEWPWLKPYIEIEGPNENAVQSVAQKLGFDWKNAKFGSVDTAYRAQYKKLQETESIGDIAEVRFDMPLPDYLATRK